ncbi:hypothetical protein JHK84_031081 [Glycine max]|nr:hypothetical protein JHK84_031081 [Glycine max]
MGRIYNEKRSVCFLVNHIHSRSNGSNITDLALASANVENFEEDSFRTSSQA